MAINLLRARLLRCSQCQQIKAESQFHVLTTVPRGRTWVCRICKASYDRARRYGPRRQEVLRAKLDYQRRNRDAELRRMREWYLANHERQIEIGRASRKRGIEFINSRKQMPCADCGKRFPECAMDFDHRDGESKSFAIGAARWRSIEQLLAEMAKCDLVCANCHRVRTRLRSFIRRDRP